MKADNVLLRQRAPLCILPTSPVARPSNHFVSHGTSYIASSLLCPQSALDAAEMKQTFDSQLAKAQEDASEMKAAWDKVRCGAVWLVRVVSTGYVGCL